jgi:predicted lysophospholipase L1 biosynthesis ABC-type transport system permease subunit
VNAVRPGIAVPGEAWISADGPEAAAEASAALAREPFRTVRIESRTATEASRQGDPFAEGVVWALAIAAVAALGLAAAGLVLAAAVHLRDERGELAELEAQGFRPEWLAVMSVARMGWLMIGGVVVGLALGVALTQLAVGAIAIAADAVAPVPPLVVVQGWPVSLAAVVGFVALVAIGVGFLVGRHFRRALRAEATVRG